MFIVILVHMSIEILKNIIFIVLVFQKGDPVREGRGYKATEKKLNIKITCAVTVYDSKSKIIYI